MLANKKKIYKYKPEMDFARQCLANVYIRKGFAYLHNSDFVNAGHLFLKARDYEPSYKPLNAYIAYVNNKLGNLQTAAKYYDNLIKTDSTKTEYAEIASDIYKSIGDTAKAIEIIKKARKQLPDDKFLLLDEASIYSNRKDYRSLSSLLPLLLDNNINNPDIVFVAANCYDHLSQYDKAESLYLHAIDLNSSAYEPVFNLGLLYLKKSILNKGEYINYAIKWVEKANEIAPNNIKCLEALQYIYAQTGNKDQINKINNKLKQLTNQ
jgi:tetratricopeptide (TPR) repeat protein